MTTYELQQAIVALEALAEQRPLSLHESLALTQHRHALRQQIIAERCRMREARRRFQR